jgi:RNA polymerase sigma factor (sigma-70 family)
MDPKDRFRLIWDAHHRAVRSYLYRRLENDVDAVLNEVFTIAWNRLTKAPAREEEARWWLLAIARRTVANHRRAAARHRRLLLKLRHEPVPVLAVTDTDVAEALRHLSAADQEVLLLHYWEDLSVEAIAVVLSISAAAARKRLQRAQTRFAAVFLAADPAYMSTLPADPDIDGSVARNPAGTNANKTHTLEYNDETL